MMDEAENDDETMHWSGKIQGSLKEWLMPGTEEEIQDEFGTFCCARKQESYQRQWITNKTMHFSTQEFHLMQKNNRIRKNSSW